MFIRFQPRNRGTGANYPRWGEFKDLGVAAVLRETQPSDFSIQIYHYVINNIYQIRQIQNRTGLFVRSLLLYFEI